METPGRIQITEELLLAARALAKHFIYSYVKRGDSIKSLKDSHMGKCWTGNHVSISGLSGDKHYSTDYIIVPCVDGHEVNLAFRLKVIYSEIEGEIKSAEAIEDFKLEFM